MKTLFSLTLITLLFSSPALARKGSNLEERKASCESKSVGDSCTYQSKRGEKTGTCKESRKDKSTLFCKGERKGKKFGMFKDLNLSEEQVAQLKEYRSKDKAKREQKKALKASMEESRNKIKQGFLTGVSDDKLISLHKEVSEKRAQLEEMRFSKMITMKNILNEEQRKKFIEHKEQRRKKFKNRKKGSKKEK